MKGRGILSSRIDAGWNVGGESGLKETEPRPPGSDQACPRLRLILLALMVWSGATGAAVADEPSKEFWPETDVWLRLSPEWRLSAFIALSKNIETHYREGNVIVQADHGWGTTTFAHRMRLLDESRAAVMKSLLLRGGLLTGKSLGDDGLSYRERTMFAELHARTPLEGKMLLSSRIRTDLRWLGEEADFSARLRYRLMLEKEYEAGGGSIVPFVNIEPYYDSRYSTVNRVRVIGGASVSWMRLLAIEGNITYQHDSRMSVTNLYAFNLILHLFFETDGDGEAPEGTPAG